MSLSHKKQRTNRYRVTKNTAGNGYNVEYENRKNPDGWYAVDYSDHLEEAIKIAKNLVINDSLTEVVWHEELGSITS
jgi:hypothetical protein